MVNDKRTRQTKERICQAMLVCLADSRPEAITVKRLCETAGINRSTFYAHYPNPIVLYSTLEQRMTERMNSHFEQLKNQKSSYMDFLRHMLACFYENSALFLALYSTDSKSLKKLVLDRLERDEDLAKTVPEDKKTYIFDYYISGLFSVVTRWLREDKAKTVDEMAALTYYLTYRSGEPEQNSEVAYANNH